MGIDHCMKMVYPVMMKEGEPMGYHIKKDFHLKNPSLLKFTVSWFSMLLIPAVMGISIYLLVLENNSRQLDEYNYQMIRTASEDLERSLCAADDFADTLNMVETLNTCMDPLTDISGVVPDIAELSLSRVPDTNGLIDDYMIYSRFNHLILSHNKAFFKLKLYYGSYFQYGDADFEDWIKTVFPISYRKQVLPSEWVALGSNQDYSLIYRIPFLDLKSTEELGQTVFFIGESGIKKLLSPIFSTGASNVWILNQEGVPLCSLKKDKESIQHDGGGISEDLENALESAGSSHTLQYNGFVMYQYHIGDHGMILVGAVPDKVFNQQANEVLKVVILVLAALFLAGIMISVFLYYCNQRPLRKIVNRIPEIDPSLLHFPQNSAIRNGLWAIDNAMTHIYSKNRELEQNVAASSERLKKIMASKLLSGEPMTMEETSDFLSSYHISCMGDVSCIGDTVLFRGVYVRLFEDIQSLGDAENVLNAALRDLKLNRQFVWIEVPGPNIFALLEIMHQDIPEKRKQDPDALEVYYHLYSHIKSTCGADPFFYLGLPQKKLQNVPESFFQAQQVMLSENKQGKRYILEYIDFPSSMASLSYSSFQEEKLLNLISVGNERDVAQLLDQIHRDHFITGNVSSFMKKVLYYKMLETMVRAGYVPSPEDEEIYYHADAVPDTEFFQFLRETCHTLCRDAREKINKQQSLLYRDLRLYLQENFTDSSLSLTSLSTEFHMTESYLSVFIKEWFASNFSTYLELLRIKKANELLDKGESPISGIAQAVGYTSSNSFGRAYKRVMGFSPSAYRKKSSREDRSGAVLSSEKLGD